MTDVSRETFLTHFPDVSRETLDKLDRYAAMLTEWQKKMNLVGPGTLSEIWTRHFLDSAQLMPYLPQWTRSVTDIGSGAGFPGMVLAILGAPHVNLIEATQKKARFLEAVATELGLEVHIHAERSELVRNIRSSVVTARAVAHMDELIPYAFPFLDKGGIMIFLKGQHVEEELTAAAKDWHFEASRHASLSDPSGFVLVLQGVGHNQSTRKDVRWRGLGHVTKAGVSTQKVVTPPPKPEPDPEPK
ncbi:MAG: 16S rRNA (guanine(527)-N(7))-methyltransferase RsmG [Alphaproteobacteria bacterium]|nr:16S rRNA (guanine(527)-N(7))-methyltransferase RsmG [Alphaproteobacteria bacterium]